MVNLQEEGIGSKASVFILNADLESASAVNKTVKIVPREKSEWDFLPESAPNYDSALCALNCRVVDFYPLLNAVGTLVILKLEEIEAPEGVDSESIPVKLFPIDLVPISTTGFGISKEASQPLLSLNPSASMSILYEPSPIFGGGRVSFLISKPCV